MYTVLQYLCIFIWNHFFTSPCSVSHPSRNIDSNSLKAGKEKQENQIKIKERMDKQETFPLCYFSFTRAKSIYLCVEYYLFLLQIKAVFLNLFMCCISFMEIEG